MNIHPASFMTCYTFLLTMIFLFTGTTGAFSEKPVSEVKETSEAKGNILLVVGNAKKLNESENQIFSRLNGHGYPVNVANHDDEGPGLLEDIDLVVVSKTVNSLAVGTRFKNAECGFMTWEDNLQMAQLMGFSENDGTEGTAWHREGRQWYILPDAPDLLGAGLSGETEIYTKADEITYSPNQSPVTESAMVVGELSRGDYHKTYYAFEKGARLGDGTPAAGRRIYFGLYDDTFKFLNEDGLKLFDAAISWGSTR